MTSKSEQSSLSQLKTNDVDIYEKLNLAKFRAGKFPTKSDVCNPTCLHETK